MLHLRMQEKKQSHCANCLPPLRRAPAQRDAHVTLQAAERGTAVGAVVLFLFLQDGLGLLQQQLAEYILAKHGVTFNELQQPPQRQKR